MIDQKKYDEYIKILREELVVALGCTEPIALAYAAAKAREALGAMPEKIQAYCSGDIIKNVKSVTIPNTGNLKGVNASILIGIVGGNPDKGLEVLEDIEQRHIDETWRLLDTDICTTKRMESETPLHILIEVQSGEDRASVEIKHAHTNITSIKKNGVEIFKAQEADGKSHGYQTDRELLNVSDIYDFTNEVNLDDVKELIDRQIEYNIRIAEEGMTGKYGVSIGKMLLDSYPETPINKGRAYAAAASEARMSGCTLPVVINSGSGNQGITASVPLIIYAREKNLPEEMMYRALVFSNLLTIHFKTGIGPLSAFCGAVCAACGAGAGIAYLDGASLNMIKKTITNTFANVSGIICDGAKPSCGAKIASAFDAAIMAYNLALNDDAYKAKEGILQSDVEDTIQVIGHIGRVGMTGLDETILDIMLK
ncbi:MAG: serine dehydratase subunit alpha family protein [Christensenellales bacterium]|jgi:L-cysteine desulfidase